MRIQTFLTAAAVNLKRLAKALASIFVPFLAQLLAALRNLAIAPKIGLLRVCTISIVVTVA